MAEYQKTVRGLECCILRDPEDKPRCAECEYEGACVNRLMMDALELLKKQEPRLLTFEQIKDIMNGVVWVELKDRREVDPWIVIQGKIWRPDYNTGYECWDVCKEDEYNRIARCWSARPTDEQRETVKWK